jgi:hypothetical protein
MFQQQLLVLLLVLPVLMVSEHVYICASTCKYRYYLKNISPYNITNMCIYIYTRIYIYNTADSIGSHSRSLFQKKLGGSQPSTVAAPRVLGVETENSDLLEQSPMPGG